MKLATELSRRATGKTLYLIDEPTTGLSFYDVHKLVEVVQRLVEKGNSVLVIEHNLDVIRCADWIIDLGPEGDKGARSWCAARRRRWPSIPPATRAAICARPWSSTRRARPWCRRRWWSRRPEPYALHW